MRWQPSLWAIEELPLKIFGKKIQTLAILLDCDHATGCRVVLSNRVAPSFKFSSVCAAYSFDVRVNEAKWWNFSFLPGFIANFSLGFASTIIYVCVLKWGSKFVFWHRAQSFTHTHTHTHTNTHRHTPTHSRAHYLTKNGVTAAESYVLAF